MQTIFKAIAISAIIAGSAVSGTLGAQASPGWGNGYGIHADVFQGD